MREEVIGDCRLILGDCRDVLPTLGSIDSVVSDPPYGMTFQSNHRTTQHEKIANDETTDLLKWACAIPVRHSRYLFGRWDNIADIPKPKSLITWVKNNWSMGDLEHEHGRQTEVCFFYPGANHYWPSKRPNDVIECPRTGNEFHPTEKPVALMEVILGWTAGVVFDPFMGGGEHWYSGPRERARVYRLRNTRTLFRHRLPPYRGRLQAAPPICRAGSKAGARCFDMKKARRGMVHAPG